MAQGQARRGDPTGLPPERVWDVRSIRAALSQHPHVAERVGTGTWRVDRYQEGPPAGASREIPDIPGLEELADWVRQLRRLPDGAQLTRADWIKATGDIISPQYSLLFDAQILVMDAREGADVRDRAGRVLDPLLDRQSEPSEAWALVAAGLGRPDLAARVALDEVDRAREALRAEAAAAGADPAAVWHDALTQWGTDTTAAQYWGALQQAGTWLADAVETVGADGAVTWKGLEVYPETVPLPADRLRLPKYGPSYPSRPALAAERDEVQREIAHLLAGGTPFDLPALEGGRGQAPVQPHLHTSAVAVLSAGTLEEAPAATPRPARPQLHRTVAAAREAARQDAGAEASPLDATTHAKGGPAGQRGGGQSATPRLRPTGPATTPRLRPTGPATS